MPSESVRPQRERDAVEPMADRFRQMLVLIQLMGREVTVAGRVRRLVEHSVYLGRASYAAFALRNADSSLDEFVFSSAAPEDLAAMQTILARYGIAGSEHLPLARASADALARRSDTQRQSDLLDVPVRTQFGLYGNLYVMRHDGGTPFTDDDRELLTHFAETTAVSVDNAAQLEEAWQRQHWLMASGEISRRLLGGVEDERQIWRAIADNVEFLAHARTITICVPSEDDPDDLEVQVAAGVGAAELAGRQYPRAGSLAGLAIETGQVQMIAAGELDCLHTEVSADVDLGHIVALPLKGMGSTRGAIVISRRADQPIFSTSDVAMAEAFANQAALALELAEARSAQQTLEAREDRERLAESLQDQVIQRLFSIGLSLQSTATNDVSAEGRGRVDRAISDIDETIRQVRASIDPLTSGRPASLVQQLRHGVLAAVDDVEPTLGFRPEVQLSGPLDLAVAPGGPEELVEVLRAALANVVEAGRATRVQVEVAGSEDGLALVVTDDGAGFGQRSQGLVTLWERVTSAGRILTLEHPGEGGVRLRWFLPLP